MMTFLAIEVTRDTRKGGQRVSCYEFTTEEDRSAWLCGSAPFTLRQRIEANHPAAKGARLRQGEQNASRPVLVLQPT